MKVLWALVTMASVPAAAQETGRPVHAVLHGVVVDSVRGGFLRGASVGVLGPSRMALTDSLGRFRIDSIPQGEYRIALFDGLLDTLFLSVLSPLVKFVAGDTITMVLAVPSPRTIVTAKCGSLGSAEEPAALIGSVLSAERGVPVAGVDVRFGWLELVINDTAGARAETRRRVAITDAHGRYRLCGLPIGLSAEISVARGADSSTTVPIAFGESVLGVATVFLPSSGAHDVAGAPIRGTVLDPNGKSVSDAMVTLSSSARPVMTAPNGTFLIEGQRLGTQSLLVRKLGYQPAEIVVHLTQDISPELTVTLDQFVPVLESVTIEARHQAGLERIGFVRRRHFGLGQYWEAEDLREINSLDYFMQTIPVLRRQSEVPRVSVAGVGAPMGGRGTGSGGVGAAATRRSGESLIAGAPSGCPRIFLDGVETKDDVGKFVMPSELAAVEAYSAVMTPVEFRGMNNCPTLLIWTHWKVRRGF